MTTNVDIKKRAVVSDITREVVLEMDPDEFNTEERMTLLSDKLGSLFKVEINQVALTVYRLVMGRFGCLGFMAYQPL